MARDIFGRESRKQPRRRAEIRVTDRRRIHVGRRRMPIRDGDASYRISSPVMSRSLRRAQSRGAKDTGSASRVSSSCESSCSSETDETRQRLNRAADERAQREKADSSPACFRCSTTCSARRKRLSGSSPEEIAEGVRRTAASFENALAAAGVEPIDPW